MDALHTERRYHLEGVHKSPILEFYNKNAAEIGKRDSFIVFLRRSEETGYAFTADDAVDGMESKPRIDSLAR